MLYELRPDIYADHGVTSDPIERAGRFRTGKPIGVALPEPLVFAVDNTVEHPPRAMEGISIPVWSNALVASMRSAGVDNLELFPAVLRNGALEWRDYVAVNVIGTDPSLLLFRRPAALLAQQRLVDALGSSWGFTMRKLS